MRPPVGFTAIKDVSENQAKVNLIGVIVEFKPPRPTRGSDSCLEFTIQDEFDSFTTGSSSILCRMFRPADKLPKISSTGDVVVIRNFKLNKWGLRIDCVADSASFCPVFVFRKDRIPVPQLSQPYEAGNKRLPYEAIYSTTEPTRVEQIAVINMNAAASGSVQPVQQRNSASSSFNALPPQKLQLIKDLNFNLFYDVRAQVLNIYYTNMGTVDLKITDYTENEQLFYYADPKSDDAHMVQNSNWTGPFGHFTMNVLLFESNAAWARENVAVGDYIYLRNLRTKMSPANKLEGIMHQDRQRPTQVDIYKLSNPAEIAEIEARRKAYEEKRGTKSAFEALKDTRTEPAAKGKKAEKRKRQQEMKEAELRELEEKQAKIEAERNGVNHNVRASFPEIKPSTISEILCNPSLQATTANHEEFLLPFVNSRHRARVRVVDVYPPELELFSHSTRDRNWYQGRGKSNPSSGQRKERWEWGFVLLVEDAVLPPNTVSEKMRLVVGNKEAQGLLNIKQNAQDLKKNPGLLQQLEERLFILWGNLMELKTEMRLKGSDLPLPPGDNRLQNKPFDCCIEEYGHEVPISDLNPLGFQRMFRLVHTVISS
ncbi:hypothetical protein IAQ61_005517 [Plenodomus lingam]|uniref:Protection of telomeres protein 1 n=1 Tax=Leptosphaeria maculans (strain JN3 / isolate v23.1.3 / race Av1-4-5-6-7-8) TaxID=985895 RepID=E4ZYU3_LEPMJ|nr:similar to telomere-binding alpha subunit central domain-containing protein [Plenodomus lingam JN3]KAH9871338.1 hypothetical protein IAQ61_005517 [Plenodomus lingam]CBX96619.1 similar to telomere-binding alpha subunit central domain-containing protein [Plenodomus lingam JN3]